MTPSPQREYRRRGAQQLVFDRSLHPLGLDARVVPSVTRTRRNIIGIVLAAMVVLAVLVILRPTSSSSNRSVKVIGSSFQTKVTTVGLDGEEGCVKPGPPSVAGGCEALFSLTPITVGEAVTATLVLLNDGPEAGAYALVLTPAS
jgi:hypothetical protein